MRGHGKPRAVGFETEEEYLGRIWSVPVVYEAAPIRLFPEKDDQAKLTVTLDADRAAVERGALDEHLPKRPDVGFFGRDETLLALDRAFDTQHVVLLHAYAGSGKTAAAAEFARWYALTGGVEGPVLFTTFEQYQPLARVLDRIGQVFGPLLEQHKIIWLALDDDARRKIALDVLEQIPVLWIWDNVESIGGFPTGSESAWTESEQKELVDFLRDARETKAKFLLTSRRDERGLLGDELSRRIPLPPMPMQERVQLARGLTGKHGWRLTQVDDWWPLLRFARGNPLTLTVLVRQALKEGLKSAEQIGAFVERLRVDEADFDDEVAEGRSKSLGASLSYGLEQAFTAEERKRLALLHLFQGFVDVEALKLMGNPEVDWCLVELRGLQREDWILLLDRAAEIGLLAALADGYYTIHPALPWFFKGLFDACYPAASDPDASIENPQLSATRAFVGAVSALGNYYHNQYEEGNRDVLALLKAEQANLLHARHLARVHAWWSGVISTMQGLYWLYGQTGRRAEWARLVEEIVPDFVDAATDGPLPGREEEWTLITHYRVRLALEARRWPEAERLQCATVDWVRQRVAAVLGPSLEALDDAQRNAIRTLGISVAHLGHVLREQGKPECVPKYEETFELCLRSADLRGAAVRALNLGDAFTNLHAIRDLTQAEAWYRRALDLTDEHDRQGRARCLGQLGGVALERFVERQASQKPKAELLGHLDEAVKSYRQALGLFPADALDDLAVTHNQLARAYSFTAELDRAVSHFRESIRYREMAGNLYAAAQTRFNVALTLGRGARFADALDYAQAALRNYETYGEGAKTDIAETHELIRRIGESLSSTDAKGDQP